MGLIIFKLEDDPVCVKASIYNILDTASCMAQYVPVRWSDMNFTNLTVYILELNMKQSEA